MKNLLGSFECKLDSKGRLVIPAELRRLMPRKPGSVYVISVGKEKCLTLFPAKEWKEKVLDKLQQLAPSAKTRATIRYYSKKSRQIKLDKAGRIAIPSSFLGLIGNPKTVTVIGLLNYLEIWSPQDFVPVGEDAEKTFVESDWEI
jgi:MraZ protein